MFTKITCAYGLNCCNETHREQSIYKVCKSSWMTRCRDMTKGKNDITFSQLPSCAVDSTPTPSIQQDGAHPIVVFRTEGHRCPYTLHIGVAQGISVVYQSCHGHARRFERIPTFVWNGVFQLSSPRGYFSCASMNQYESFQLKFQFDLYR